MDNNFNPDELPEELAVTKEPLPWEEDKPMNETILLKEHRFTISLINGQPGLVVREDDPALLKAALVDGLSIFSSFKKRLDEYNLTQNQSPKQATPQDQQQGLQSNCETCGTAMIQKSGIGKNGKPWNALMCPNSVKGQPGHAPIWL